MVSDHYLYRFHGQPIRTTGISWVQYGIYNHATNAPQNLQKGGKLLKESRIRLDMLWSATIFLKSMLEVLALTFGRSNLFSNARNNECHLSKPQAIRKNKVHCPSETKNSIKSNQSSHNICN